MWRPGQLQLVANEVAQNARGDHRSTIPRNGGNRHTTKQSKVQLDIKAPS